MWIKESGGLGLTGSSREMFCSKFSGSSLRLCLYFRLLLACHFFLTGLVRKTGITLIIYGKNYCNNLKHPEKLMNTSSLGRIKNLMTITNDGHGTGGGGWGRGRTGRELWKEDWGGD